MSKKITIITRNMLSGGAERVIAQLANYFADRGICCKIITMDQTEVFYSLDPSVAVTGIGEQSANKLVDKCLRYGKLRKQILQDRPDVVLSMPEEIGVYVLLALLGTGIPVYVSERNNPWVMPDVKVTRMLRRLMYPFARGLIFQTEMARSYFPERIRKKGVVIPNPVDRARIPKPYEGVREKVIVGAGRLEKQKNFGLLVSAFARFSRNHPEYSLCIYGEGSLRPELEALARNLGIQDRVLLPGRRSDLLEQMNLGSMFVLSSDYEGMPNVLIEAMCMGMAVIATDCPSGGPRELIQNGENGILVPVGSEEEMAQAMEMLMDPERAEAMGRQARRLLDRLAGEKIFRAWKEVLVPENQTSEG